MENTKEMSQEECDRSSDQIGKGTQGPVESPSIDEGGNEEEEYIVEQILGTKLVKKKIHYLIKWTGWGNEYNSWEPFENLDHCRELIMEYEEKRKFKNSTVKKKRAKLLKRLMSRKPDANNNSDSAVPARKKRRTEFVSSEKENVPLRISKRIKIPPKKLIDDFETPVVPKAEPLKEIVPPAASSEITRRPGRPRIKPLVSPSAPLFKDLLTVFVENRNRALYTREEKEIVVHFFQPEWRSTDVPLCILLSVNCNDALLHLVRLKPSDEEELRRAEEDPYDGVSEENCVVVSNDTISERFPLVLIKYLINLPN